MGLYIVLMFAIIISLVNTTLNRFTSKYFLESNLQSSFFVQIHSAIYLKLICALTFQVRQIKWITSKLSLYFEMKCFNAQCSVMKLREAKIKYRVIKYVNMGRYPLHQSD